MNLDAIRDRAQRCEVARSGDMHAWVAAAIASAADVPALLEEIGRLRANVDRLIADKGSQWEDGYRAGCEMSHSLGCDAVEAERDMLRDELARREVVQ